MRGVSRQRKRRSFAHLEILGTTKPPIVPTMKAHKIMIPIIAWLVASPKCEATIGPVAQTHKMDFIKSRRSPTPLENPKALIAAANPIQPSTAVPIRLSKVMPTNQPTEKRFIGLGNACKGSALMFIYWESYCASRINPEIKLRVALS